MKSIDKYNTGTCISFRDLQLKYRCHSQIEVHQKQVMCPNRSIFKVIYLKIKHSEYEPLKNKAQIPAKLLEWEFHFQQFQGNCIF